MGVKIDYNYYLEHGFFDKENRDKVRGVRAEIFRLAKNAPDMETISWYVYLDECFENDELQLDELNNLKWRATVLSWKNEPAGKLLWLIDDCTKIHGIDLCNIKEV